MVKFIMFCQLLWTFPLQEIAKLKTELTEVKKRNFGKFSLDIFRSQIASKYCSEPKFSDKANRADPALGAV